MNEHTEHMRPIKGLQPRSGRRCFHLIKPANSCASCKHSYNCNPQQGTLQYPKSAKYACNLHNCEIKLSEWCKYHKKAN